MKGKDIHKQIESILDDLTPAEELERTHQRICQYLAQADETYQLNHINFIQELEYKIDVWLLYYILLILFLRLYISLYFFPHFVNYVFYLVF